LYLKPSVQLTSHLRGTTLCADRIDAHPTPPPPPKGKGRS